MAKKKKSNAGRPTVMTQDVLNKLEQAFTNDLTDEEASLYAGITAATLYNYQKANPEFLERKTLLRNSLGIQAKQTIATALKKGDKDMTKWWAERKRKSEFSTKMENEVYGKGGGSIAVTVNRILHTPDDADQ